MKILILGHYEIASNYAISMVVNRLLEHDLCIMLSGKGDKFEGQQNEFTKLAQHEQQLCDELNQSRDPLNLYCDGFDLLANKTQHPIKLLEKPNSKKGLDLVRSLSPDLVISIRYRKILKAEFITLPKYGVINLHSGLLPEYRGAMATFWTMMNQDRLIGSTLHYISDPGIDTGKVIARSPTECDYAASYLENVLNLYPTGVDKIIGAVDQIIKNKFAVAYAQSGKGNYYSFPGLEDLEKFQQKGNRLL